MSPPFEGRAVWASSTSDSPGGWVDIKEAGDRIHIKTSVVGGVYLTDEQALCLAGQLRALVRMREKRV